MFRKPIEKTLQSAVNAGKQYLEKQVTVHGYQSFFGSNRNLDNSKPSPTEVFTSLIALDLHMKCCKDFTFIPKLTEFILGWHQYGYFSFFKDERLYRHDIDSTSIGLSILLKTNNIDKKRAGEIADDILRNTNSEDIIQIYFNQQRPRVDIVVCINALYLIHLVNKHDHPAAKKTEDYVYHLLLSKKYKDALRYYLTEEQFIYFLSRLVHKFPDRFARFHIPLKNEITSKIGYPVNSLELSMRVITAQYFNIDIDIHLENLKNAQLENGSWPASAFFRAGSREKYYGSEVFNTLFGLKALQLATRGQILTSEGGILNAAKPFSLNKHSSCCLMP